MEEKGHHIVMVRYYSETTMELSQREYAYYSEDRLKVDDIVSVPVRGTTTKAKVCEVDVPASEVEAFKDSVKTIPAYSVIPPLGPCMKGEESIEPEELTANLPPGGLAEAAAMARAEVTVVKLSEEPETALELRPGEDIEVTGYHAEAVKLQKYAEARVITTLEDVKTATDDLSIIANLKKAMEAKRKEYVTPLQTQVKEIQETYKTLMQPVFEADSITRGKMLFFNMEQARIRQEQEDINRKRQEAAEAEMRLKGELTESVNLVEVVPEAPKIVSTGMGSTGMRDNWKYRVVNFAELSDEYKIEDSVMLNSIAKGHHDKKPVKGIVFYNEPIIAVRAKGG